ncbi:MAG TPA: hypothetical protein VK363_19420 [Pyrinomonadaceae bacterium]|nr:hypothetical protein [Pyrinomonadaceae bacterium]
MLIRVGEREGRYYRRKGLSMSVDLAAWKGSPPVATPAADGAHDAR